MQLINRCAYISLCKSSFDIPINQQAVNFQLLFCHIYLRQLHSCVWTICSQGLQYYISKTLTKARVHNWLTTLPSVSALADQRNFSF